MGYSIGLMLSPLMYKIWSKITERSVNDVDFVILVLVIIFWPFAVPLIVAVMICGKVIEIISESMNTMYEFIADKLIDVFKK